MSASSPFERQNEPGALKVACAFRRRYTISERWRMVRLGTSVAIGTIGVVLALMAPTTADYVSAVAAGWIVFSRLVLTPNEQRQRRRGNAAQELFDTSVYNLPWSTSVAGTKPVLQDILCWGKHQSDEKVHDWYPDTRPARYPVDVLLCQRATITWARQDHNLYADVLRWTVGIAFVATVVIGIALDLSLGEYLLRLGVPVLPAGLDVLDIAADNADLATRKTHLEAEATALLERCVSTGLSPQESETRELQNGIYATRVRPGVPNWLYLLTRDDRQRNMEDAITAEIAGLPSSLRT